jgi:shikimate 5-dehydrogenase
MPMSDAIVVVGAGGHAKVVLATLHALGVQVAGVFDDNPDLKGKGIQGSEIKGPIREAPS